MAVVVVAKLWVIDSALFFFGAIAVGCLSVVEPVGLGSLCRWELAYRLEREDLPNLLAILPREPPQRVTRH